MTDATPYGRRLAASLVAVLLVTTVLGPIGTVAAAPGVSVSHETSQATVNPGDTITITATFVQTEANTPAMEPDVPDGWSITQATAGTDWSWFSQQQTFLGSLALSDDDGVNGTYTHTYTVKVPDDASSGDYTIASEGSALEPGSGDRLEDTASTTVTVEEPNTAPTADAGTDQTVDEGASVTLDASGSSDSDGSIASYSWTQTDGPSVSLSDASAVKPTFPAPDVTSDQTLTFEVTVTDDDGAIATDTVDVVVQAQQQNTPPTASFAAEVPTPLTPGTSVTFDASGSSDSDGSIQSYAWDFGDGSTATGEEVSHAFASAGTFTVELTVTDDDDATGMANTSITVEEAGLPPIDGFENAPMDPDDDGTFEDVNGDGSVDVGDVQAIFANRQDPVVTNNVAAFDFNDDGSVNVGDVQALFAKRGDV